MWGFMWGKTRKSKINSIKSMECGGETGIRTLGPREGTTVFETAPFDHSGTSPYRQGITDSGLGMQVEKRALVAAGIHPGPHR